MASVASMDDVRVSPKVWVSPVVRTKLELEENEVVDVIGV